MTTSPKRKDWKRIVRKKYKKDDPETVVSLLSKFHAQMIGRVPWSWMSALVQRTQMGTTWITKNDASHPTFVVATMMKGQLWWKQRLLKSTMPTSPWAHTWSTWLPVPYRYGMLSNLLLGVYCIRCTYVIARIWIDKSVIMRNPFSR